MTTSPLSRAFLLYDQGRHDLAADEARRVLTMQPDDAAAHALLALCLLERKDYREAMCEGMEAVRLDPAAAYPRFVLANVLLASGRPDDALPHAEAARHADPTQPANYAMIAQIHLERRDWQRALDVAETGLALDPEHVPSNNLRAMALVKLGRRAEAGATIRQALSHNPDDAFTHANQGWTLLHEGRPKEAMLHFRESLRIDPTNDWARAGIVEALKARNFVYRWMLAYFLFMARLSHRAQWGILIGGWVLVQVLRQASEANPAIRPFAMPIIYAFAGFAILTWLAYPFFNLLLRLHPIGRYALSNEQRTASNWIGGVLLAAIGCGIASAATGWDALLEAALMVGLLTLPLAGVFGVPSGWPRMVMTAVVCSLALAAAFGVYRIAAIGGLTPTLAAPWESATILPRYAMGIMIATVVGNAMAQARVRKA